MSNNRWEIVTNPKRQRNLQKRIDAQASMRKEAALPNLEEICKFERSLNPHYSWEYYLALIK